MVYDWSEIELTTVRDVTDSYTTGIALALTLALLSVKPLTKTVASSSFKMDASRAIKSLKLCKFSLMSYIISLLIGNNSFRSYIF